MGLLDRKHKRAGEEPGRPRAVLAAAMPIEGKAGKQAWQNSTSDTQWQTTAWYYYDAVGELRFAHNWIANAVSRATLYAAEIDPETGLVTGPTEDARAQAAASAILGGADDRPQLQSTMALHWQIPGETFVLVVPQSGQTPDRWLAMARTQMRERGGRWQFEDPLTGVWTPLRSQDRVIRIWSPHPAKQAHADSAMRPGNTICQEIEKASQNIIARLDSRLAGNGIMWLPNEIDFPTQDGEPADAQSFMKLLMEASEAAIAEPGTAAAHVPIMAQIPGEWIAAMSGAHSDLSTAMDSAVTDLRKDALNRLGNTLDMSREIATGGMAEANHWTAWQIEEGTYKIHVEPFLLKLGMALTGEFFRPALAAMGVSDPDRFVLAWDITEVVARPDDTEDTKWLWDQRLVSADHVRSKFSVPDDAMPSDDELFLRRLEDAVNVAPTLAADGQVAERLFGFELAPAAAGVSDPSAVDQPALEAGTQPEPATNALPERDTQPPEPDAGLVAAAELVVFDALSRAGGRLLTPAYRGQFKSTPRHELHTVIPVGRSGHLLEGSFQFAERVALAFGYSPIGLEHALREYVEGRLSLAEPHNPAVMIGYLQTVART